MSDVHAGSLNKSVNQSKCGELLIILSKWLVKVEVDTSPADPITSSVPEQRYISAVFLGGRAESSNICTHCHRSPAEGSSSVSRESLNSEILPPSRIFSKKHKNKSTAGDFLYDEQYGWEPAILSPVIVLHVQWRHIVTEAQWLAAPSFDTRVGGSIPALVAVSLSET